MSGVRFGKVIEDTFEHDERRSAGVEACAREGSLEIVRAELRRGVADVGADGEAGHAEASPLHGKLRFAIHLEHGE